MYRDQANCCAAVQDTVTGTQTSVCITGKRHKNVYVGSSKHAYYTKCSQFLEKTTQHGLFIVPFCLLKNVILVVWKGFPYLLMYA
jgi:hypothetical protein